MYISHMLIRIIMAAGRLSITAILLTSNMHLFYMLTRVLSMLSFKINERILHKMQDSDVDL